jgi:hypothetical protein
MEYNKYQVEEDIKTIINDTFDTCENNRDEIRWLICILRGFMEIPHKRNEYCAENYKINLWQYQLNPIIQNFKEKWSL